jgi:NTE family protein
VRTLCCVLLLLCCVAFEASAASDSASSPKIGLVLSGGGARGAAHIGVLKVLEEYRIPIDAIAGTSMGAVVGGLYASGLSAYEIESVVASVNWQDAFRDRPSREDLTFRRKLEDQNFLVKFPLGLRSGKFLLPKGLIQGQKLNQTLRAITLPVANISRFDDLPVPFRAVATDLETGEAVVLSQGDLAGAMRASISAPGVFAPVPRDERLLVDGGLVENLPVQTARAMGVDILIAVDVGTALADRQRLNSVATISNQMLAILIRQQAVRQREQLTARDILIEPPLASASSFDFTVVRRAIDAGEEGARSAQQRLSTLSVSKESYQNYLIRKRAARSEPPVIEFVRTTQGSENYSKSLQSLFKGVIGKPLDPKAVARSVDSYYGRGNLETLDYTLEQDAAQRFGIALSARRNSWGPNYVRFGLNLQDDFAGNSDYNAAARGILSEVTQLGGEWVWDAQVGDTSRFATELYLPIAQASPYFIAPRAELSARNVDVLDGQRRIAEYRVRSFDLGVDLGRELGNWGEARAGLQQQRGRSRVRLGDPNLPTEEFDVQSYFLRLAYDELDNVNFPSTGTLASLQWRNETDNDSADVSTDQLEFNWLTARSYARNTAVFWTTLGTTLDSTASVRSLFSLGGFLNLSGLKNDSISGPHFGVSRLMFYRQIGREGPGFLNVPAYLGVSFEAGNVWQSRSDASFSTARKNASLFLGFDTLMGPVYLATGIEDGGPSALYLFLGRTF